MFRSCKVCKIYCSKLIIVELLLCEITFYIHFNISVLLFFLLFLIYLSACNCFFVMSSSYLHIVFFSSLIDFLPLPLFFIFYSFILLLYIF